MKLFLLLFVKWRELDCVHVLGHHMVLMDAAGLFDHNIAYSKAVSGCGEATVLNKAVTAINTACSKHPGHQGSGKKNTHLVLAVCDMKAFK